MSHSDDTDSFIPLIQWCRFFIVVSSRLTKLKQDAITCFTGDTNHPHFKLTWNKCKEIMTGGAGSKLRTILFYLAQHWVILPINAMTLATRIIFSSFNLTCSYKGPGSRWSIGSTAVHGDSQPAASFLCWMKIVWILTALWEKDGGRQGSIKNCVKLFHFPNI